MPYEETHEQEILLKDISCFKKIRIKRSLEQNESITIRKDTIGYFPFDILHRSYVIRVESAEEGSRITEVDGNAIITLVVAFTLAV